ncbi:MAG: hypothetical protein ACK4RW_06710 [Rehaibacterium terrae]|uniref:hypothetical protein n=1 Tax=Rehaibacterium terrae TaxID=1341696 RepID=UPI003919BF6A
MSTRAVDGGPRSAPHRPGAWRTLRQLLTDPAARRWRLAQLRLRYREAGLRGVLAAIWRHLARR